MDKVIEALRRISTCLPERYQQLVSNEKWQKNKLSSVLVEKEDILDVLRKYLRVCTRVWTWTRYRDILSSFNYAALGNCDGRRCSIRLLSTHSLIDKIAGIDWLYRQELCPSQIAIHPFTRLYSRDHQEMLMFS